MVKIKFYLKDIKINLFVGFIKKNHVEIELSIYI